MVRLLERDDLVERRPDPAAARAHHVFLTERARSFEPVAAAALAELDALVLGALGSKRAASLKAALRILMDATTAADASRHPQSA